MIGAFLWVLIEIKGDIVPYIEKKYSSLDECEAAVIMRLEMFDDDTWCEEAEEQEEQEEQGEDQE